MSLKSRVAWFIPEYLLALNLTLESRADWTNALSTCQHQNTSESTPVDSIKRVLNWSADVVGTGPEHVRAIASACNMLSGSRIEIGPGPLTKLKSSSTVVPIDAVPAEKKSKFAAKIRRVWQERFAEDGPKLPVNGPQNFVTSVEVNPHPGLSTERAVNGARLLRDGGIDVVNIADGPRAVVRMANWALGLTIQKELDMEFIQHVCCRDRNLLGIQADLLGTHVMGVRNLVIITGDPPKLGDYPKSTAVFDLDSVELLKLINSLNHGIDPAGKMVGEATEFFCACGAEPGALNYDREMERLARKVANGAELIMTQPVYDPKILERFLNDCQGFKVPIMVGILPLANARNADFLHNEVPGMQIPQATRDRMHAASEDKDLAREVGIQIAQEMLDNVKNSVVGAYLMPPFSRYQSALDVLSILGFPGA